MKRASGRARGVEQPGWIVGSPHVLDRRHDTIISDGSNIYPREVEDVLIRHPAVKEAIVFGVPDAEWGESVVAAVVTREGQTGLDADRLLPRPPR